MMTRVDGGSMPSPPSGNVVRRELIAPPVPYAAPRTELEERMADIWRTALNMDRVGINDDFNDLGADSMIAAIIFGEIEESFGITIPMATILVAPTIAQLAVKVSERVAAPDGAP
jgi:acyl carrier protein